MKGLVDKRGLAPVKLTAMTYEGALGMTGEARNIGAAQMLEADARASITFAAPEAWVDYPVFERPSAPLAHGVSDGAFNWRFEEQIRLGAPAISWYYRMVDEVVNATSLEDLAAVAIDFDPAYERVIFHHARIIRGETVIELPIAQRYILMRREKNFESSMLDGQWTLGATLPDVRVGDVVDIAFTCSGTPAIFGERFGPSIWMQGNSYHYHRRVRLLNPADSHIQLRPFIMGCVEPQTSMTDDGKYEVYDFEDRMVEPYYWESKTPGWLRPWKGFYVSNTPGWTEIAELEFHGYAEALDYPDELISVIDNIAAVFPDPADRIVEALRYVQNNIRYFSVSMGTGGYIPRPLDEIFNNRMGDCKDVSKLLTAMLTRMGIEAHPALVDTQFGLDLINSLPRIWAFDHCIVQVVYEGQIYWFDATSYTQYGKLPVVDQADFGYALPLKAGGDLVPMASGLNRESPNEIADLPIPDTIYEVVETIHLNQSKTKPCEMGIDYIYRGAAADYMRYTLSHRHHYNFAKDTCELYAHIYGGKTMCALPRVTDNRDENELIIHQSISTEDPWLKTGRDDTRLFISPESAFGRLLEMRDGRSRHFPYDLGKTRRVRHVTRLITDYPLDLPAMQKSWVFGPLSVSFQGGNEGGAYVAVRDYFMRKSYLIPSDKAALDDATDEIEAYDRLSIIYQMRRPYSWIEGFKLRTMVWAIPAALTALGLLAMAFWPH
jgi:hypothetical protein